MRLRRALAMFTTCAAALLGVMPASAAGPRWVADARWINDSQPMNWYRPDVQYFVDQGPLSGSVDQATASALVDAAATVWNVAGIHFTLTHGGSLSEDVSGDNVYLGTNGPVWPADVQSSNYAAKQIAVIFDNDGSITDTLLGSGASAPSNCRQNAVMESVDLFIQPGKIAHALIVLNGRCTGPAPEQQLQLRYQLMRVFGRVIGLGWSQVNDNVFTGAPAPQYLQQLHWPIMHPIDIVCGPYAYQCLPQPFTLREDDTASLAMVNAVQLNAPVPNKIIGSGWLRFPDGEGMSGVNITVRRNYPWNGYGTEPYEMVSAVTGFVAPGDVGNPVTGASSDTQGKGGGSAGYAPGYFVVYGVPAFTYFSFANLEAKTEAINPLYVGSYAVGPYRMGGVMPSGSSLSFEMGGLPGNVVTNAGTRVIRDAASRCNGSADGTENAPAPIAVGGVWSGRLCGISHTSWSGFAVRAGRTATLEVTAVDESGNATTGKAMPVIGLWHAAGPTGVLPTAGRTPVAFNSIRLGTTQLRATFATDETVRLAVADQRGDARPDYTFRARLLYAGTVSPSRVEPAGGAIRIVGMGFQRGSVVTVGGVLADVVSLSATEIDAVAPTLAAIGGTAVNDVTVTDPHTGASATITAGLTYGGAAGDVLTLLSAPAGSLPVGASASFSVRLTDGSGQPAANGVVTVSANGAAVLFSACGLAVCTLVGDADGIAQTRVTPQAAGPVTLAATTRSGATVQSSFTAVQVVHAVTFLRPVEYVASGAGALFEPAVTLTASDGTVRAQTVVWTSGSARVALGAGHPNATGGAIDATGSLRDGEAAMVQACAWANVCATQTLTGVAAAGLRMTVVSGDGQSLPTAGQFAPVTWRVTDSNGYPVAGAAVSVYQQVSGWQPPCAASGRCAKPPVYGSSTMTSMSDDDGIVTVVPLQYPGTAAVTKMTATAGSTAVLTVTLEKTP